MSTFTQIPHKNYEDYEGSTRSDMFGPVELDPRSALPMLSMENKKALLGPRFIKAGCAAPDDFSDDSDEEEEEKNERLVVTET